MQFELSSHSKGKSILYLQLTPRTRRYNVFMDKHIKKDCECIFYQIAKKLKVWIEVIGFGPDHVHLLLTRWKNYTISYLAFRFKGASSHYLRQKHIELTCIHTKSFWAAGYYYDTVGKDFFWTHDYVKYGQVKHWIGLEKTKERFQRTLNDFI